MSKVEINVLSTAQDQPRTTPKKKRNLVQQHKLQYQHFFSEEDDDFSEDEVEKEYDFFF